MSSCKPYGNIEKAKVLVIGHDPRLQNSEAQAQYAFFLDYLERPLPLRHSERRKYELASAVVGYIQHLSGSLLLFEDMYFTNLCNEFLNRPSGSGTVLIPDELANRGIDEIEDTLSRSKFELILPMAPQVFYHLVRAGFVADQDENVTTFLKRARPRLIVNERKTYWPARGSPFLMVCGKKYRHRVDGITIIPIVHIKQWSLNNKMKPRYGPLMEEAVKNIHDCLRSSISQNGAC